VTCLVFGVPEGVWLAVPLLARIGVLLALEALKPEWRVVLSAHEPTESCHLEEPAPGTSRD